MEYQILNEFQTSKFSYVNVFTLLGMDKGNCALRLVGNRDKLRNNFTFHAQVPNQRLEEIRDVFENKTYVNK